MMTDSLKTGRVLHPEEEQIHCLWPVIRKIQLMVILEANWSSCKSWGSDEKTRFKSVSSMFSLFYFFQLITDLWWHMFDNMETVLCCKIWRASLISPGHIRPITFDYLFMYSAHSPLWLLPWRRDIVRYLNTPATARWYQTTSTCTMLHYSDVIMITMASQITSISIVCSGVCSGAEKTSKLRVTGLCERNSPVTSEFPAQRISSGENVTIWWYHHATIDSSYDVTYSLLRNIHIALQT